MKEKIDKIVDEFMNYDGGDLDGELTRILEKHLLEDKEQVENVEGKYTPENMDKFMNDKGTPIPRRNVIKLG